MGTTLFETISAILHYVIWSTYCYKWTLSGHFFYQFVTQHCPWLTRGVWGMGVWGVGVWVWVGDRTLMSFERSNPGAHFINHFSIVIQIWWKIGFSICLLQGITSFWNSAHAMTAQLLCHVQHFTVITTLHLMKAEWNFHWIWIMMKKNHLWNRPLIYILHLSLWCALSCCYKPCYRGTVGQRNH